MSNPIRKGRGAQIHVSNRFDRLQRDLYLDDLSTEEEREEMLNENPRTKYLEVFPKTIVNRVDSPDLGFEYSMNPYQGCEHGCAYCYARVTHEYWGYNAGLEFEQHILIKKQAPELLKQTLSKKSWQPAMIVMSGNTDCYQPVERRLQITRKCLEIMLQFRHPVGLITKNALILRDLDILRELAALNLVRVNLSLTTLNEDLKRILEPRTSTAGNILKAIRQLSDAGVPVHVLMAPVIPSLNDHEILPLTEAVAAAGARDISHQVVRLNGQIGPVFEQWLDTHFPDRKDNVLNHIKALHGGEISDHQFKRRFKGEGKYAELISRQFQIARKRYMKQEKLPPLDLSLFRRGGQGSLW